IQEIMSLSNKNLYWGQIVKEGLPSTEMLKDDRIREKYVRIGAQGKLLQETFDQIIVEGQQRGFIDTSLKPQILRQMLGGASQQLFQGLALQNHGKIMVGYDEADVRQGMTLLIDKFVIKK
ncbi:MAG: hypothetical protein NTX06_01145, partial [Proteobacteria bacterium]|nr:hypothetical protein [Pseudomonadota bacterium]